MQAYGHEGTRTEELRTRRYVQVLATFDVDGRVMPRVVTWPDGRAFMVDEVVDVRQQAASKAGGTGTCYAVRFGSTVTKLYKEDSRWFVEALQDTAPA
ncbi:MAG TPA: hypothetical protein IAC28_09125 [Candidatus Aphodovivens excrementavium]|nr:hypothetical protein [Candidatus Aphodovivens excrementavium]